jgi:transcription elongation factor GreA
MKTFITIQGLELLKEKLNQKKEALKDLQAEKAHAYTASGDGWHDNPGWTQLGQQEEMLSMEIVRMEQRISNAVLMDLSRIQVDKVQIGCRVTYFLKNRNSGKESEHSIYIVGMGESDIRNGKVSYDSPIGKALYNLEVGEEKEVVLPNGKALVKVKEVVYE